MLWGNEILPGRKSWRGNPPERRHWWRCYGDRGSCRRQRSSDQRVDLRGRVRERVSPGAGAGAWGPGVRRFRRRGRSRFRTSGRQWAREIEREAIDLRYPFLFCCLFFSVRCWPPIQSSFLAAAAAAASFFFRQKNLGCCCWCSCAHITHFYSAEKHWAASSSSSSSSIFFCTGWAGRTAKRHQQT